MKAPQKDFYIELNKSHLLDVSSGFTLFRQSKLEYIRTSQGNTGTLKQYYKKHYKAKENHVRIQRGGGAGVRSRGGGGTLIFSHIRRLGNSEFQYFFGFSEK